MVANNPVPGKKYFSVAEANATLPLVRAILRDITELAEELIARQERLERLKPGPKQPRLSDAHQEEVDHIVGDLERGQERMRELAEEVSRLGIELKDYRVGLVDFPCWMGNREVYLCWRLDEPEGGFWHELDAGFAGRQQLKTPDSRLPSPEVQTRAADR